MDLSTIRQQLVQHKYKHFSQLLDHLLVSTVRGEDGEPFSGCWLLTSLGRGRGGTLWTRACGLAVQRRFLHSKPAARPPHVMQGLATGQGA